MNSRKYLFGRPTKTMFVLLMVFTYIFSINNNLVRAQTQQQWDLIDSGILYYDIDPPTCGPGANTGNNSTVTNVYMLGDSITDSSEDLLRNEFQQRNISVAQINGVVGRSISAPGNGNETGLQAIENDSNSISSASGIIIALGTNSAGATAEGVKSVVDLVKSKNTANAKVFWVNIFSDVDNKESFNQLLATSSTELGFTVIDTTAAGIELSSDGIHPTNSGYELYAKTVVGAMPQSNAPAGNPIGGINISVYSPQVGGDIVEGGYESSRSGLDGEALVRTLDDFRDGSSQYVTLAGDPSLYEKTYLIPSITYDSYSTGQKVVTTLNNVKAYVHDTGSAFIGQPEGRYDVPVGKNYTNTQMNTQPFANNSDPANPKIQLIPYSEEQNTTGLASGSASGPVILETPGGSLTLDVGWQPILSAAAARFEVDPYILAGILRVETGWPNSQEVEAARIRNSATATGPFQILDLALQDISDRPDEDYARNAQPSGRVINSTGGTGTAFEPDGSLILDGNKDGVVSRHNPWDAAFMSAAYVKSIGGIPGLPLGDENEPLGTASQEFSAGTNTVSKVLAHYNQGPNWTSSNPVQGNNNVEHYMVNGVAAYEAVRNAGWFAGGVFNAGGGCETTPVTGSYVWPVSSGGRITSCWSDLRNKTISGGSYYHSGVDIAAGSGEQVVSVSSGTVRFAGQNPSYGGLVIVEHANGIFSHYGHLSSVDIAENATVSPGQPIGKVGNTGVSLGDHLHLNFYETWPFGELPVGAATSDGTKTINPFTSGLVIPADVPDEASCYNYPNGGREVDIDL